MNFNWSSELLENSDADLVFVTLFQKEKEEKPTLQADGGQTIDKILGGEVSKLIAAQEFKGKEGETLLVNTLGKIKPKYLLIVGVGKLKDFSLESVRRLGGTVASHAKCLKAKSIAGVLENKSVKSFSPEKRLQVFVEGALLAGYSFSRKKKEEKKSSVQTCTFHAKGNAKRLQEACAMGQVIATSVNFTRELVNRPPNDMTPTQLAKEALALAKQNKKLKVRVLGPAEIRKEKMGGLISVTQGSNEPAAFIHLKYEPTAASKTRVALVGKGVCFDSGGLNIKTREMEIMKIDMGGAASVLGVFHALTHLPIKVAVEGFIPACENMPSGTATRPSDIITTRSGKTIEIMNTDAEGRVILADALDVAQECKPTYIVDMATLTGGAAYAVGEVITPVLGNDQKLIDKIIKASEPAGEPMWQLPLFQEYKKGYTNGPADIKNSGAKTRASCIMGALFLEEFVGENKWAHLDIASPAWAEYTRSYQQKDMATGAPVRTLLNFLMGL